MQLEPKHRFFVLVGVALFVFSVAALFFVLPPKSDSAGDGGEDVQSDAVATAADVPLATQIEQGRSGQRRRVELSRTQVRDAETAALSDDDEWLAELILDAGVITDDGIKNISRLPALRHLRLRNSPVTDVGLERLADCKSLRILNLPQSEATAAGIATLAALPKLRNLRVGGERLEGATAESVAKLTNLRSLHLIGVPIDDEGLRLVAALPKLQSLYLDDCAVTSAGWDWLFETHPRLHVHVDQKHLDRDPHSHSH
jgi:hypothetical protein